MKMPPAFYINSYHRFLEEELWGLKAQTFRRLLIQMLNCPPVFGEPSKWLDFSLPKRGWHRGFLMDSSVESVLRGGAHGWCPISTGSFVLSFNHHRHGLVATSDLQTERGGVWEAAWPSPHPGDALCPLALVGDMNWDLLSW